MGFDALFAGIGDLLGSAGAAVVGGDAIGDAAAAGLIDSSLVDAGTGLAVAGGAAGAGDAIGDAASAGLGGLSVGADGSVIAPALADSGAAVGGAAVDAFGNPITPSITGSTVNTAGSLWGGDASTAGNAFSAGMGTSYAPATAASSLGADGLVNTPGVLGAASAGGMTDWALPTASAASSGSSLLSNAATASQAASLAKGIGQLATGAATATSGSGTSPSQQAALNAEAIQADPEAPYRAQYAAMLNQLETDPSSLVNLPGYQAGLDAIQRAGAANGMLGSGNLATQFLQYGGNIFQNQVSQLQSLAGGTAGGGLPAVQSSINLGNATQAQQNSGYAALLSGLANVGTSIYSMMD